jgi:hypothetical protein
MIDRSWPVRETDAVAGDRAVGELEHPERGVLDAPVVPGS